MDVKQRIVFSQVKKDSTGNREVVVCAEPSPDALTVLGASGSLSLGSADKVANAATALAESGAFVGLRTQSIQLLRDAMYRLCEGYAAGAVNDADFAAMQRRYQSTMMGLIAIEQLTRPVVAGQILLTSSASAQAGASAGDTSVDKAQERAEAAKSSSLDAQKALDQAALRDEKARKDLRDVDGQVATEKAKKEPDQATIANLEARLPDLRKEEVDARLALTDARRRSVSADESVRNSLAAVRAAQAKVSASASGGGALGAIAASAADSTKHLTDGVVLIVAEINASYTKDACLALLIELAKSPDVIREISASKTRGETIGVTAVLGKSLEVCERILVTEAKRVEKSATLR